MKRISRMMIALLATAALTLAGCSGGDASSSQAEAPSEAEPAASEAAPDASEAGDASLNPTANGEEVTLLVAAAASLEYSYTDELIPLFQEKYPNIKVEGTYDSSGKLQTQIEEGLEADVFMSAAVKQMDALKEGGFIDEASVVDLLENKIVLIKPAGGETAVTSFEEAANAETIAVGDPESVPAGQYAQEAFTSLGIWDAVEAKSSKGTNVTEVLSWVSAGSAEIGVVYATDAATTEDVEVITEAPEGSLAQKVIYPVGMVSSSAHPEEAKLFIEFLQSPEAIAIFEAYGFTANS